MSIPIETRRAYTEIDNFLELLDEEDRKKVPEQLREIFKTEKDTTYTKTININEPISEQNLKEETLGLIALLNLKYWCTDEKEKIRLTEVYDSNENAYQEKLRQKYNPDDIFKKDNDKIEQLAVNNLPIQIRENIFQKIFRFLKNLFNKE